jgi:CBS domain-containing protein
MPAGCASSPHAAGPDPPGSERSSQMKTVTDLLQTKGHGVWSVVPDASVYEALELMAAKDIGAVLVLEDGQVAGIFSERDYARKIILKGKASRETPVREIMTSKVLYVRPEQSVAECMALMTGKHIRHLPVMSGDELIGLISIGDVVKAIIDEQEFMIEQLENYITSRRSGDPRPG